MKTYNITITFKVDECSAGPLRPKEEVQSDLLEFVRNELLADGCRDEEVTVTEEDTEAKNVN